MPKPKLRANSFERWVNAIFASPWLWGTAVTFVFYGFLPYLPALDVQRYFSAHWLQNIQMGLFFIGICALFGKLRRIPAERKALQKNPLDGLSARLGENAVACAVRIEADLEDVAKQTSESQLLTRIRDACQFVVRRGSSEGLEGYLAYLAEVSRGRLHDGYALIRTITWAVPILGFLGTVVGITMSTSNSNLGSLDSSLPDVIAKAALAFDSTALAMALAVILVFGKLIIERFEQQTLDDVEDFGAKRLLGLFPATRTLVESPLIIAEQKVAEQLLARSETMIHWQVEMWQKSLENLRERWSSTLTKQQEYLDQALQHGLTQAFADHSQQLEKSRSEFLTAFQAASDAIGQQLSETRSALADQQQRSSGQLVQTWNQFRTEITQTRDEHARQLALLTQAITAEVGGWQNQLQSSTEAMAHQFQQLRSQGDVFLKLTENESQLLRLESRLTENLQAVRVVDTLEQTLINLNAAVNLLTTRAKSKAA